MSRNEDFSVGIEVGNPDLARGAREYAASRGLNYPRRSFNDVVVNPEVGRRIAAEYEAAPEFDPAALPHYRALRAETEQQYDFLTRSRRRGGLGVDVTVSDQDPYPGPRQLLDDLANNRHLAVLSTASTGGHPFLTDDDNDMFRAVHDAFGHAATGRGFDRHGEEAAWHSHRSMYTPEARPAMTSETRGQNSALIFGSNPGTFAPQKVVTLSTGSLVLPMGRRRAFHEAVAQARGFHEQAFGE